MSVKIIKDKLGKSLYVELRKDGLKPKEMLFIAEYITNGFNATEAYMNSIAGKKTKRTSGGVEGHLTLKKAKIQASISKMFDYWLAEKKIKLERELCEILYKRATYDISTFVNDDGSFKQFNDIEKEWHCVIDGTSTRYFGKDASTKVVITKLADRDSAIDKLDKYIQMTRETKEINISDMRKETEKELEDIFEGVDYTLPDKKE